MTLSQEYRHMAEDLFKLADEDEDGFVTRDELDNATMERPVFMTLSKILQPAMKQDGDRRFSLDEFMKIFQQ